MAVDATPGGAASDSYCTLAEAEAYHANRLHNTTWTGATNPNKEAALKWATRLLDAENWVGVKATSTAALRWPRMGVLDKDGYSISSSTIPVFLKNATAEYALQLLESDVTDVSTATSTYSGIKVGPIDLKYTANPTKPTMRPEAVKILISPFIDDRVVVVRT